MIRSGQATQLKRMFLPRTSVMPRSFSPARSVQYGGKENRFNEDHQHCEYIYSLDKEGFGYLPDQQPHDGPYGILIVEDIRTRYTNFLGAVAGRLSVGIPFQAS